MELDGFNLPALGLTTKIRGHPKKVIPTAMPDTESSTMVQTHSQSNGQRNMSAIDSFFSQSSVTTLPTKLNPKAVVFIHSSTMGLKIFD